VSQTRR